MIKRNRSGEKKDKIQKLWGDSCEIGRTLLHIIIKRSGKSWEDKQWIRRCHDDDYDVKTRNSNRTKKVRQWVMSRYQTGSGLRLRFIALFDELAILFLHEIESRRNRDDSRFITARLEWREHSHPGSWICFFIGTYDDPDIWVIIS